MKKIAIVLMVLLSVPVFAEWKISTKIDVLTDKKSVSLYAEPTAHDGGYGNNILMFRKTHDDVALAFDTVLSTLYDNKVSITYRIDSDEAVRTTADASSMTGVVFLRKKDIKKIITAKHRVIFQATSYNGVKVILIFDMEDFSEKYQEFMQE